jgi:hypothetical protein
MWQKAKVLKTEDYSDCGVGLTLWVKVGPPIRPKYKRKHTMDNAYGIDDVPHYQTNLVNAGHPINVDAEVIELLAESADDVELVDWNMWFTSR